MGVEKKDIFQKMARHKFRKFQYCFNVLIVILFIVSDCYALSDEDAGEKKFSNLWITLKKCMNCFMCGSPIREEEQEALSNPLVPIVESEVEALPTEILHKICFELSPVAIFYLLMTSKNLNNKIDDRFWKDYLEIRKWEILDNPPSYIKIAFSHVFFENGKIGKAAQLMHPKAIKILENRAKIMEEKYNQYRKISIYRNEEYGICRNRYPFFLLKSRGFLSPYFYGEIEERY